MAPTDSDQDEGSARGRDSRPFTDAVAPAGLFERVLHEDIRGPYFGWHVAAYVVVTSRGYFAYGKLCRLKPDSVWDTPDAKQKMALGPCRDAESALEGIFQAVEARLTRQPFNRTTLSADLV